MIDFLRDLLRETLKTPRAAARRLIDSGLAGSVAWTGYGIVVTASAVLAWLSMSATPVATGGVVEGPGMTPLGVALVQAISILLLGGVATVGGRVFGGTGRFPEALLLAVWLEFILILLQVVQLVVMIVFPFSSVLIGILGMVLFLWLLTNFVAELHGFSSLPRVFFGIVAGFVIVGFVLVSVAGSVFGPQLMQQGL
jgi:hypothetical protein